ncbi:MAG: hypothetical protein GF401_15840 [Chitinivibrionales bacterium]|nr:hypothetical protein [Chitinivibrionales bacterium]
MPAHNSIQTLVDTLFPKGRLFMKHYRFYLSLIVLWCITAAQNHLPDERKSDWENAGILRSTGRDIVVGQVNNILEYGARNDGTHPEITQTALQASLGNRSAAGYTAIYFPEGVYIFSRPVRIERDIRLVVIGDGANRTFFHFNFNGEENRPGFLIEKSRFIGISNLSIERQDSANYGENIRFSNDTSCWVSGVESNKAPSIHIHILNSSHIEITGCHIHHAWNYGTGGHGYGVLIGAYSSYCLVENSIFNHLRHSVILSNGPVSNVIGYNYSTDPYTTETYFGISDWPSDMCLHGHPDQSIPGPSFNLFEGNRCAFMHADDAWYDNGPCNTYFRNKALRYGIKIYRDSPNQNVVANEIDDLEGDLADRLWKAFDIQSSGNFILGNSNLDANPPSYPEPSEICTNRSLYLDPHDLPDFLDNINFFPPFGASQANRGGNGTIPAQIRWNNDTLLTVPHPYSFDPALKAERKHLRPDNQNRRRNRGVFPIFINSYSKGSLPRRKAGRHGEIRIYDYRGRMLFEGPAKDLFLTPGAGGTAIGAGAGIVILQQNPEYNP